ncbi:p21-activated protein kinase-interacting protein 1-like [Pomacea canaliculata]|uniref:p21-activated protein kinase-interacting protein 1-like n=1 Tax=Pomacea canaliculata TaxID=400727 RepID=UPI000D7253A1|nr:p21-activated protein kinase-interacting protein 1-like [Pomacea canaliculata]
MEIVTGTYEELLFGYTLVEEEGSYSLLQTFTDHSHKGCIKCVAISDNKILVSGCTDESIHIYNLRTRKEHGTLEEHEGSLTRLEFFQNSHLFSTGEDGKLCVWKVAGWEVLRTFKGHKGAVNCVSIHPSGKMALTVGQDHTLKTWNLVTGRPAYTSNIKQVADLVLWSPSGDCYAVSSNNNISIYKVDDCKVCHKIQAAGRICALAFLTAEILAYAGDGGIIFFYDVVNGKELYQITTDTNRIRGLSISLSHTHPDSGSLWLTSVSSDGYINVYSIQVEEGAVTSQLLVSHKTKFRLTCVATSRPTKNQSDKSTEETSKTAVKTKKQMFKTSGREHDEENQTLDLALSEQKPKKSAKNDKNVKKRKAISEQDSCSKKAKKLIKHKEPSKNRIKKKKARSEKKK